MPFEFHLMTQRRILLVAAFLAIPLVVSLARATSPPAAGALPPEVLRAFETGTFAVPAVPHGLGTSSANGGAQAVWRVPVVLVGFKDMPLRYDKAAFDS